MSSPPIVKTPRFLQRLQWAFAPTQYLDDCVRKYGDCFIGRIGDNDVAFFSHPDVIAQIFSQYQNLDSGRTQASLRLTLGHSSSLVLDGEPHRKRRQLLLPPFHGERMRAYGSAIQAITKNITQTWQFGDPIEMLPQLNEITMQVILTTVFGVSTGERYERIKQQMQEFLNLAADPITFYIGSFGYLSSESSPLYRYGTVRQRLAQVDELIYAEIRDRREQFDPNRTDILTLLLSARDEDGEALTDVELRDELMTMLLAGHDSSAATLAWALYHIHMAPAVRQKLAEELDAVGAAADPMTIVRLSYLSAVCCESLRLRSAAPTILGRITNRPMTLGGYDLPADTFVMPCNYLTHRRDDLYPDPLEFQPERFLERSYATHEFYPFGGGNRYCIGSAFAQFEMKLVLAQLLRSYELTIAQKTPIRAVRRGVNTAPEGGVKMTVQPRVISPAFAATAL